ncbi:unnamed protein product, partial [Closterium sp. Naga37s-1]
GECFRGTCSKDGSGVTSCPCIKGYRLLTDEICVEYCPRDCGANAVCGNQGSGEFCFCNKGFEMLPDTTCADKCASMKCGANATCSINK